MDSTFFLNMRVNPDEGFNPHLPSCFLIGFPNSSGKQAFPDFNMAGGLVVNQRFTGFFLHHEKTPLLRDDGGNGGVGIMVHGLRHEMLSMLGEHWPI